MTHSLQGITVFITRPIVQAQALAELIKQQGGQVLIFPMLRIEALENSALIRSRLNSLSHYHWLIFISANAVNFFQQAHAGKIKNLEYVNIAAIGKATAKALTGVGLTVDLIPSTEFNSEGLLAMPQFQQIREQKILIVRGQGGREFLANTLGKRGAKVDYLEVYRRMKPEINHHSEVIDLLNQKKIQVIIVNSVETLNNLMTLFSGRIIPLILDIPLIVISHRIQCVAYTFGFKQVLIAESPNKLDIMKTVSRLCNGEDCDR